MKKVVISEALPGMLVGREVISEQGVVLLDRGTHLTQAHISCLQRRGITLLYVEEHPN
ncbi:MAG: hypothetical protein P4N59_06770 [Negativicutes bacterium]|nr:hypothetical protein [Negativicutes bacterium]